MQSYHTIPYHLGRRGLGFATTNSKANSMVAHCACPVGMRRNGRVHPGISGTLQPPLLLAVCVCTVCEGEGGKLKSLVPNILRATPVCWVSLRPCTVELGSRDLSQISEPGTQACACPIYINLRIHVCRMYHRQSALCHVYNPAQYSCFISFFKSPPLRR